MAATLRPCHAPAQAVPRSGDEIRCRLRPCASDRRQSRPCSPTPARQSSPATHLFPCPRRRLRARVDSKKSISWSAADDHQGLSLPNLTLVVVVDADSAPGRSFARRERSFNRSAGRGRAGRLQAGASGPTRPPMRRSAASLRSTPRLYRPNPSPAEASMPPFGRCLSISFRPKTKTSEASLAASARSPAVHGCGFRAPRLPRLQFFARHRRGAGHAQRNSTCRLIATACSADWDQKSW